MRLNSLHDEFISAANLFSTRNIFYGEIDKISIARTISLCDEIAIFLSVPELLVISEADKKFF